MGEGQFRSCDGPWDCRRASDEREAARRQAIEQVGQRGVSSSLQPYISFRSLCCTESILILHALYHRCADLSEQRKGPLRATSWGCIFLGAAHRKARSRFARPWHGADRHMNLPRAEK